MKQDEMNWLQEMMRLSGVEDDAEEELLLPGMLPQEDENSEEPAWQAQFRLAEEQTWALIKQQEKLGAVHTADED